MNRVGKVILTEKEFAIVEMTRTTACSGCSGCGNADEETGDMEIRVYNPVKAKKGDVVEINMDTQNVLLAAAIAYGLPFFALIIGILLGDFFFKSEIISAISGISLLGITYYLISFKEKSFYTSKKYVPVIDKVYKNGDDSCFIIE